VLSTCRVILTAGELLLSSTPLLLDEVVPPSLMSSVADMVVLFLDLWIFLDL